MINNEGRSPNEMMTQASSNLHICNDSSLTWNKLRFRTQEVFVHMESSNERIYIIHNHLII